MRKVWIEVALNGAWGRRLQPGIPDSVETIVAEGVACARAGATIIHTHAYTDGGKQTFDWQVYARIIEGIRAEVDVPVYPSYPPHADATTRFAHIDELAARGLLDFAVIDPGSVNFTQIATTATTRPADTYLNPEAHIRHALAFAARHGTTITSAALLSTIESARGSRLTKPSTQKVIQKGLPVLRFCIGA